MQLPPHQDIADVVGRALAEDVGPGDITAGLVSAQARCSAQVVIREQAVLCGQAWFDEVSRQLDEAVEVHWLKADGDPLPEGALICTVAGPARSLLTGERSALNFLQIGRQDRLAKSEALQWQQQQ